MNCILFEVVDNYTEIIDNENKDSIREIFEHFAAKSMQIKKQEDIDTGYFFFSGFKEAYHIYFSKKILLNYFKTNPAELFAPHIEQIDYNRWAELEFKEEMTVAEMNEKQVLERVYNRLRRDDEVYGRIKKIKGHT